MKEFCYQTELIHNSNLTPEIKRKLIDISRVCAYNGVCPDNKLTHYFERDASTLLFTKDNKISGFAQFYDMPEVDTMWHSLTCVIPEEQKNGILTFSLGFGLALSIERERKYQVLNTPNPMVIETASKFGFRPFRGRKVDEPTRKEIEAIVRYYKTDDIILDIYMVLKGDYLPTRGYKRTIQTDGIEFDYSKILNFKNGDRLVMFNRL